MAEKKTYTSDEVEALLNKQKEDIFAEFEKRLSSQTATAVKVESVTPKVLLRFRDEISETNQLSFGENGKYGTFYGNNFVFSVTKEAFIGDFRNPLAKLLLDRRKLIVLDGLTDAERIMYNVSYKAGEILEPEVFDKILSDEKALLEDYPMLCETYKIMIAKALENAYNAGNLKVSRECIEKLNAISKEDYKNADATAKKGLFYPIISAMNKKSEG